MSAFGAATRRAGTRPVTTSKARPFVARFACTAARGHFAAALDSGSLGAPEDASSAARRQATRMAELALEELAHVLPTRATRCAGVTDEAEEEDVAGEAALEALLTRDDDADAPPPRFAPTRFETSRSPGFARRRHAAARELEAATEGAGAATKAATDDTPTTPRFASAAVERAARLAAAHASTTRAAYGDVPANVAAALGLPPYAGDAFVDGVVRGAAPHPLARFLRPLRRAAIASSSSSASSSAERCVAAGAGTGRLVEVDRLSPGCLAAASSSDDPAIVFAWRVTGDEDVFAAGRNVRGIISANALLPSTRLATRARQEGIPMTATSSPSGRANAARAARALAGEFVTLVATPDGVKLNRANDDERDRATREHREERREERGPRGIRTMTRAAIDPRVETRDATRAACAPLADASTARCGAKAAACADLLRVAARPGSGFRAPDGVVLPFGCLELCARERGVERRL